MKLRFIKALCMYMGKSIVLDNEKMQKYYGKRRVLCTNVYLHIQRASFVSISKVDSLDNNNNNNNNNIIVYDKKMIY